MLKTVIVGLLLAFLLFTPQGHFVAATALLAGIQVMNRPDPAKVAAEDAAFQACNEKYNSAKKAAFEKAKTADHAWKPGQPVSLAGFEFADKYEYKTPYDLATGKGCGEASRSH
jgi:hypothetical protein